MNFTASRGQDFVEEFTFKNAAGQALIVPAGDYVLTLERGSFISDASSNLTVQRNRIVWAMSADEVNELKYSSMYFALKFNGQEVTRGVLRVN